MKNTLIYIAGATGIGKTALSVKVANYFDTEIISCDSRQFFKEMSIGTAVPSPDELSAAPHHFIHHRSVLEEYSVGHFERDALQKLAALFAKKPVVVLVGGSGLYAQALIDGLDYFPEVPTSIREELNTLYQEEGITALQKQLKELDINSYHSIAIDNPHRLIRALEICIGTGKPYSSFKNKPKEKRSFKVIKVGLTADREMIYHRINQRVDIMMENGLLDEVKKLYPYKKLNALNTVGYKELFTYLDGEISLQVAVDEIKKNTRRFAKRQLTWNRKDDEIHWFQYNENATFICDQIKKLLLV